MHRMDASAARTENMRRLVADAGGPAGWSRQYGGARWQQPQVSQWISPKSPKRIGRKLARDLELAMDLPAGELDRPRFGQDGMGLDFSALCAAYRLMQLVAEIRGEPSPPSIDMGRLATAYELARRFQVSESESRTIDAMRAFAAKLDEKGGQNT